jgi:hypothetical protein
MKTFDKFINNYINESIIDIPRNSLDHTIWEFMDDSLPIMHPPVKTQIEGDILKINDAIRVKQYYAVGSVLTKKYSQTSDIDITVQVVPRNEQDVAGVNFHSFACRMFASALWCDSAASTFH